MKARICVILIVLAMAGCAGREIYAGKAIDGDGVIVCVKWENGKMTCSTREAKYVLCPWEEAMK